MSRGKRLNVYCNKQTWTSEKFIEGFDKIQWKKHEKGCRCPRCRMEEFEEEKNGLSKSDD